MPGEKLPITTITGTATKAGEQYGKTFAPRIVGFASQETKPTDKRLAHASKCWASVQKHAPQSAAFMRGLSRGANLSIEHITLLTLHEEIYPWNEHCTAFAATRTATRGGRTLVAMNWDWNTPLYPWAGLIRLNVKGWPRMVGVHYPGLWMGAGVNSAGVGFSWTSACRLPLRHEQKVGVPTYVLINEVLRSKSTKAALKFLKNVPLAGSFLFFIGDPNGDTALIEATPKYMKIIDDADVISRANHFECPDSIEKSDQEKVDLKKSGSTCYRSDRMAQLMAKHNGKLSVPIAKKVLLDRDGDWPWLHQFPSRDCAESVNLRAMTIDSILVDCDAKTMHTCRGGETPGPWQSLKA